MSGIRFKSKARRGIALPRGGLPVAALAHRLDDAGELVLAQHPRVADGACPPVDLARPLEQQRQLGGRVALPAKQTAPWFCIRAAERPSSAACTLASSRVPKVAYGAARTAPPKASIW